MSTPRLVPAFCAGTPVTVAVRPSPPDHRRVSYPSCGAQRGNECKDLDTGNMLYTGHSSRKQRAEQLFGGENP